jgi:hypothetical protein
MFSIDQMFPVKKMKETDAAQLCDSSEQPKEAYPNGVWKALTAFSGTPAGLAFFCSRCKVLVRCGLEDGDIVRHCGKAETIRKPKDAPTLRVGTYLR